MFEGKGKKAITVWTSILKDVSFFEPITPFSEFILHKNQRGYKMNFVV